MTTTTIDQDHAEPVPASRDAWRLWRLLAENPDLPRPTKMQINTAGHVVLSLDDRVAVEAWAELLRAEVIRSATFDHEHDWWKANGQARISWEGRDELVDVHLIAFTKVVGR